MPSSPTNIPHKVSKSERFIPKGNVYKRGTENQALKNEPKSHSTVLGRDFEDDRHADVICHYNIGREQHGLYGHALCLWIAGKLGMFVSSVKNELVGYSLEKVRKS